MMSFQTKQVYLRIEFCTTQPLFVLTNFSIIGFTLQPLCVLQGVRNVNSLEENNLPCFIDSLSCNWLLW